MNTISNDTRIALLLLKANANPQGVKSALKCLGELK